MFDSKLKDPFWIILAVAFLVVVIATYVVNLLNS